MPKHPIVIRQITVRIQEYPLIPDRAIAWTHGIHATTCSLIITVRDQSELEGYGETVVLEQWTGEAPASAQTFVEQRLTPALVGQELDHPTDAARLMEQVAWGWEASKGAVDCAVWDLWGKQQNRSVAELICDRKPKDRLLIRASIGGFGVEQTVRLAQTYRDLGVRVLKFKVGLPDIDDARRLAESRAAVGDELIFTIDANGVYPTADAAIQAYEAMAQSRINLFEQPTPRRRISMLGEVRHRIDIPVMADDCVFKPSELEEVLALEACDVVSLYPGKNGGFTHCLSMARRAADCGIQCAIGTALESDLGQGAMAALAASLKVFSTEDIGQDLQASVMYEHSSVREPMRFENGYVQVPTGPGFGVKPK